MGPCIGQNFTHSLPNCASCGQYESTGIRQRDMLSRTENGCCSRAICTIAIQHDRDTERIEKGFPGYGCDRFAIAHVAAANKDSRILQIARTSRVHSTMNDPANILGAHSSILQELIHSTVDGNNCIENTCLCVGIQLY